MGVGAIDALFSRFFGVIPFFLLEFLSIWPFLPLDLESWARRE
jgi:hypothetical protein